MNKRILWRVLSVTGVVASVCGWQALGGGRGERPRAARPLAGQVVSPTSQPAVRVADHAATQQARAHPQQTTEVALCQAISGEFCGVDARACPAPCGEPTWRSWQPIPWEAFAQGEYVGPARMPLWA